MYYHAELNMIPPEPSSSASIASHAQTADTKVESDLVRSEADPSLPAVSTSSPEKEKTLARHIFFGPDGLRAGWSFLLFISFLVLLAFATNRAIAHFHLLPHPTRSAAAQPETPRPAAVGEAINFVLLVLASLFMARVERRPFARYGLSLRGALKDFALGLFWGFTLLSALIATLMAAHAIVFEGLALHRAAALDFGLKWALVFLLVGFFEEFLTRGYIQYTVGRGVSGLVRYISPSSRHAHAIGFWVAAFLFSVCLFMSGHLHNSGETFAGIAAVGLAGAVFAFSLYRTGTLWWAIGMHAAWDWAQTYFYGVSDSGLAAVGHLLSSHPAGRPLLSGGTTGPEGSLFVIPTLLLAALVIHYTLPRRKYPVTPAQAQPPQSDLGPNPLSGAKPKVHT